METHGSGCARLVAKIEQFQDKIAKRIMKLTRSRDVCFLPPSLHIERRDSSSTMAPGSRLEGFYSPFASDSQGKDGIYVVSPSESTTSVNTAVDDGDTGSPGNHGVKRKLSLGSIHFAKRRSRLWPLFALAVAVIVVSLSSHLSGGVLVSFHSVSQKRTTM